MNCSNATPGKKHCSVLQRALMSLASAARSSFYTLKPYLAHRKVLFSTLLPAAILVAAAVIGTVAGSGNGFIEYEQNIEIIDNGSQIRVVVDDELLTDVAYAQKAEQIRTSIDGNVAAFMTEKDELYIVKEKHLKKIADDVVYYELSAGGDGLAYAVKDGELYGLTLYSIKDMDSTLLTEEMCSLDFSLAPDGKSAAYYVAGKDNDVLMFSDGSKTLTVTYDPSDLVGLSNSGRYIYAICENESTEQGLYCFNTRGKRQLLGSVTTTSIKFNDDHTQIMFYDNGKTYISVKGKEGKKASSNALYLVTAPNSQGASDNNSITYPITTLFDHVYTCSDGVNTSAWLIKKKPEKSETLVSNVSSCTLDTSAKYLYYIHNNDELRCVKIRDGASASDRYKTLAHDVDAYAVTSDRSKVYYTSCGTLYSGSGKKGGSIKKLTTEELGYSLCINRKNVVYFVMNGDLYACGNGKTVTMVLSGVEAVYQSSNGIVYAYSGGTFYTTLGAKKLTPVLEHQ